MIIVALLGGFVLGAACAFGVARTVIGYQRAKAAFRKEWMSR